MVAPTPAKPSAARQKLPSIPAPMREPLSANEAARIRLHYNEKEAKPHQSHSLNDWSKPIKDYKEALNAFRPDCSCQPKYRYSPSISYGPHGDYRHPFGPFYAASTERLVSWFSGAAGASHVAIGHYSGSVVQKRMMDQPRKPSSPCPSSSRSDVLRISSHCA